jgi:hypothetical protein
VRLRTLVDELHEFEALLRGDAVSVLAAHGGEGLQDENSRVRSGFHTQTDEPGQRTGTASGQQASGLLCAKLSVTGSRVPCKNDEQT